MRRARKSPIPPSLYRHFALVTVLLTAGLALFADGENREAIAKRIEAQERTPSRTEAPRLARAGSRGEARQSEVQFDHQIGDFDPGFGRPSDNPGRGRNSSALSVSELAEAAGYTPEYLASLTPEERQRLLEGLAEGGMLSPEERRRRSAELAAASARRSGAPTKSE